MNYHNAPKNLLQSISVTILFILILLILPFILELPFFNLSQFQKQLTVALIGGISIILIMIYFFNYRLKVTSYHSFQLYLFIALLAVSINLLIETPLLFLSSGAELYSNLGSKLNPYHFLTFFLISPLVEEIFFRDFIFRRLLISKNFLYALLVSTILFSIGHLTPYRIPSAIILALITGTIYYLYKDVLMCILFHSFSNLTNELVLYFNQLNSLTIKGLNDLYGEYNKITFIIAATLTLLILFLLKQNRYKIK